MRRLFPPFGLVAFLLAALPSGLSAQEGAPSPRAIAAPPLAEAQALLESGRTVQAERLVERVVTRSPRAATELQGRSAELAALYLRVRARMLPVMAETLYGAAKTSYDEGRLDVASAQFDDLRRLVDSAETRIESLRDLGMLAEGFTRLIRRQLEPRLGEIPVEEIRVAVDAPDVAALDATPAPITTAPITMALVAPPPAAPPAPVAEGAEPKPFAPWRPQEYGSEDPGVTPPVTIEQSLPPWVAPSRMLASRAFRGLLSVVVGEDGLVFSVQVVAPSFAGYDALLLAAAKHWRYEPAIKDGRPVRFRKVIEINLLRQAGS